MQSQNIITVDWEDWFHICEVDHLLPREKWDSYPSILPEATAVLLDFFKTHNITATFFILGYCAQRYPELVKKIAQGGHELAYHGHNHRLVYELTREQFRQDIKHGKQLLEDLGQQTIRGFRAPQWSLNMRCPWGLAELAQAGYRYDSSHTPLAIIGDPTYPEMVHTLQTENGSIQEFPPLILKILGIKVPAGGGWGLKTWPMKAIAHKTAQLNAGNSPATFFVHPVDVVNFSKPVRLPFVKKLVTEFALRTTISALESLIQKTNLISIRQFGNFT